jgi:hypothetical protein
VSPEVPAAPVFREDGGLRTELYPSTGAVYLSNEDGDTVRLEGDEVQRAARLLLGAHVDRGRFAADARAAAAPAKPRKARQ